MCKYMMQCFKKEIMVATKKSAFYEWVNVSKPPYTHLYCCDLSTKELTVLLFTTFSPNTAQVHY